MSDAGQAPRVGRYRILEAIASGGTSHVHVAAAPAKDGAFRLVAIKTLHDRIATSPDYVAMLLDEAHLTSRVRHGNVVSVLEVVDEGDRLHLVMEYVAGLSLSALLARARERNEHPTPAIASAVVGQVLRGLQAAHTATDESGAPLDIVHRDVSPENILVGDDGVARVIDFGVAKARERVQETGTSVLKGKVAYTAPELFEGDLATRQADVYGVGAVLWEMLAARRLYAGHDENALVTQIRMGLVEPPSVHAPRVSTALDDVVMRALALSPRDRFESAEQMGLALEEATPPAGAHEVSEWVRALAHDLLDARAERLTRLQRQTPEPGTSAATRDARRRKVVPGRARAFRYGAAGAVLVAILAFAAPALRVTATRQAPTSGDTDRATPAALAPLVMGPAPPDGLAAPESPTLDSADDNPQAFARGPHRRPRTRRTPTPPPPPSSRDKAAGPAALSRDDCAIPFRIGPDRRKIYKAECLEPAQ
jgi:serine/threonine-protein kinase